MAEAVGLVIGGVSLATLLDQCLNIINYVDSGIHCGEDYQDAALMLTMLGGRLRRWERTYQKSYMGKATEEDGENAQHWLKQIYKRLQEAEKLGERYEAEAPGTDLAKETTRSRARSSLIRKLQGKNAKKGESISFAKRARWALYDQDKMQALTDKLDKLVTNLEKLFPELHDQRIQTAEVDAGEVVQQADAEGYSDALGNLKSAALKVDIDFNIAATAASNTYRNIKCSDGAMVSNGNYYSEEWIKAGGAIGMTPGHVYDTLSIGGKTTTVLNGDTFGGQSVFGKGRGVFDD